MSHNVFISYSRRDLEIVKKIVPLLEQDDIIKVWIDYRNIKCGDLFKKEIFQAIEKSSVVLFFSSQHSNQSKRCIQEIGVAGEYDKVIIPIRLDESSYNEDIKLDLLNVEHIDFSNPSKLDDRMSELIQSVKSKLSSDDCEEGVDEDAIDRGSQKNLLLVGLIVSAVIIVIFFLRDGKTDSIYDPNLNPDLSIVVNDVPFVMKYVEGGTFQMGATKEQEDEADEDEIPIRYVTVGAFYIGETEVTQSLWKSVMGSEPTTNGGWSSQYGRGDDYPAYMLSWNDCKQFIEKLNSMTQKQFRLPTEAEWEFAARGGNRSKHFKYAGDSIIDRVAWYEKNSLKKSHPVKNVNPNELGLYDMSGNIWEWCLDDYEDVKDCKVLRGGSWKNKKEGCRASVRYLDKLDKPEDEFGLCYGFRLVLPK